MGLRPLVKILLGCLALTLSFASCALADDGPPRQYVFLIDLSASQNPEVLRENERFLTQTIQASRANDRFVIMQMQDVGLVERPRHWETVMPSPKDVAFTTTRDKQGLQAAQRNLEGMVHTFFVAKGGGRIQHTDIFTSLQIAKEYANDSSGRLTELILLSDMLQSANGVEMEHLLRMPPSNWLAKQKQMGLIPSFPGACVIVIGADPTTKDGVHVRSFWQAYFTAANAKFSPDRYRVTAPSAGSAVCR